MNISTKNAKQIVEEMSAIIGHHVNMMNENGIIIASTDPSRIGTYHGGAAKIIEENLSELVIQNDNDYEGTKQGINLPIFFDGEIVGVIGVTGDKKDVEKYGRMIKKMTEILLLENSLTVQKNNTVQKKIRFLNEWLLEEPPYSSQFIDRGLEFGIDVTVPKRIVILEIQPTTGKSSSHKDELLIENIRKTVKKIIEKSNTNILITVSTRMICFIPDCNDTAILNFTTNIQKTIFEKYNTPLNIGIDERENNIYASYIKATKALIACNYYYSSSIRFYASLNIEPLLETIPLDLKTKYIAKLFRQIARDKIESYIKILGTYFSQNGSINKTSEILFMHKNTLQYKLNKIHEITGYDPRKHIDASLFILAIQFYRELSKKSKDYASD